MALLFALIRPSAWKSRSRKFALVVSWMPPLRKASPRLARGGRVGAGLQKAPVAFAAAHRPDPLLGAVRARARDHVPREVFAIGGGRLLGGHRVVSAEGQGSPQPTPQQQPEHRALHHHSEARMVWMPFHPARREACGVEAAMKPGRLSALLTFAGVPFSWLMGCLISTTSSFVLRGRSLHRPRGQGRGIVRIGTSPKGVILVATSGGKRVLRCVGRLIHRTFQKTHSAKFVWPLFATARVLRCSEATRGGQIPRPCACGPWRSGPRPGEQRPWR